jgi:hypothetical protein
MTRARNLARLGNQNIITADANFNVGIGSTTPDAKLDVVGIVSATAFYGDGSNLDGITSAGLGTAVEAGSTFGGEQIYYTNTVLGIGGTVTVDPPSTSNVAYTQYVDIAVDEGADLIIADGDDLVPDILGIGTDGITVLPGNGGRVRADNFTNKAGTGAPTFSNGVIVTGVATATSFSGTVPSSNLSGALPALDGSALTNLNIPAGFNELDAALFN